VDAEQSLRRGILGTPLTAEAVGWCVWGLSLPLAVAGAVLWVLNRDLGGAAFVPQLLLVPGFASVGVVVAVRRPDHRIGWLFLGMGLVAALTGFGFQYAVRAGVTAPGSLPAGWLLAAVAGWTWPLSFAGLGFALLLFPDGGLPSPRWRPLAWTLGVSFGAAFVWGVVRPEPIDLSVLKVDNPLGIGLLERALSEPLERLVGWVVFLVWVVTILACLLAPFVRWRQAGWEARQQLKWLALVAGMSALLAVAGFLLTLTDVAPALGGLLLVAALTGLGVGIPLAVGVAILRHRLYEIDRIISRSLAYVLLTAAVIAAYVALVSVLGGLLSTRASLSMSLVVTVVVAVLFEPARRRIQLGIDRLLFGERRNPSAVLARLGRLEATLAPELVLGGVAQTVASALRLPYAAVELRWPQGTVQAAHGDPVAEPVVVPLVYQQQPVGRLLVSPRAGGERFTGVERRLLEDLAGQVALVASAVRLTVDLQHARERLVLGREEERRRLHRDLHDGLGPTLAGVVLGLDAVGRALGGDQVAVRQLVDRLKAEVQAAVADTRRLVYELRPPALDELGLVAAVRKQAAGLGLDGQGLQVHLQAPDRLDGLPAAVEVAAYRITLEALTNARRHAQARRCQVRLALENGLRIEVRDDGRGVPADAAEGVGLASMRERAAELGGSCTVEPRAGGGTAVRARLPLHPAPVDPAGPAEPTVPAEPEEDRGAHPHPAGR
jgi:signal transduction histidine kinase